MSDINENKTESKLGAGFAGAGGGTLLAIFASSMEDGNPLKLWLLYAAPTITILLTAIWVWVQVSLTNYLRDKQVKLLIENARNHLENALENNNTSEVHKDKLRSELEQLELITVERVMEQVKSLGVVTTVDIEKKYNHK